MLDKLEQMEKEILTELEGLGERFLTIALARSDFQLEKFVVAQHDAPPRQWWQAILELKGLFFSIQDMRHTKELEEIKRKGIERTDVPEDDLAARRRQINLEKCDLRIMDLGHQILARIREARTLLQIAALIEKKANNGKPFTTQQIQDAEFSYWQQRLLRQHRFSMLPSRGDANSVLQMFTEIGEERPALPEESIEEVLAVMGLTYRVPQLESDNGAEPQKLPDNA